jgi:hypothetical protein
MGNFVSYGKRHTSWRPQRVVKDLAALAVAGIGHNDDGLTLGIMPPVEQHRRHFKAFERS